MVADFDGDQKPDLVSMNGTHRDDMQSGPVGPGAFAVSFGIPTQRLQARDLDGDKDRDLVLETSSSIPLAVWINDGAGHFERGNLDDFRLLLSREDAQSWNSAQLVVPLELTENCPRGDAVSHPGSLSPEIGKTKLAETFEAPSRSAVYYNVHPRGPPLPA